MTPNSFIFIKAVKDVKPPVNFGHINIPDLITQHVKDLVPSHVRNLAVFFLIAALFDKKMIFCPGTI